MATKFCSVELVSVTITQEMRDDKQLAIISDNVVFLVTTYEHAEVHYPDLAWKTTPLPTIEEYKEMYPQELAKLEL